MTPAESAGARNGAVTPEALREDIARTREQLGETVEALAAKADVKARVRQKAAGTAGQARQRAAEAVGQAREQARLAGGRLPPQVAERVADRPGASAGGAAIAACAVLALTWLLLRRARRRSG